ncbi:MAG: SurA N-terminal domain-containing protein [Tidjanibacter sp.]|nr:SurA N-terminal domain-containing protein [Tidjanibacter sp.]
MATLNDLRTKGGVIVTAVIALGLVAFLLGDLFSNGSVFTSKANRVGKINGQNIEYQEYAYQTEYVKNIYSALYGTSAFDAAQYDAIYNEAWNDLVMANAYASSFGKLGLVVSEQEVVDMIQGGFLSPVITSFFSDPTTRTYSPELLRNFLAQVESNQVAFDLWNYIKKKAVEQRLVSNFSTLVSAGFSASNLDVEHSTKAANTASQAKVVVKPYYTIADSLVEAPTKAEIKKYYNEHKELFRQKTTREVEYAVFSVEPSEADFAEAKEAVETLAEEFKAAANALQFATANTHGSVDNLYYAADKIAEEYKPYAFGNKRGQLYGPVLNGTTYTMARIADIRNMPDEIGARHILLSFDQDKLADSIVKALRGGAKFAELAEKYSLDGSAQNGGDLGKFAPEAMVPEFSNALLAARLNEVVKVESQFGIHVAQLTYRSKPVRKAQVAVVTYEVVAGDATIQVAANEANKFIATANNSSFAEAAAELGVAKRTARIRNTDRSVSGFDEARELVRWAYNNKTGKISGAMEIDGDYVVATVTKVREEGYMPLAEVQSRIVSQLRNEKKAAWVAEQTAGVATIEEAAEKLGVNVVDVEEVLGNANNIVGVGPDMKLVGALAAAEVGVIEAPLAGNYGVYVYVVENQNTKENATVESEKVRLDSYELFYINERIDQALSDGAEIVDERVRFF